MTEGGRKFRYFSDISDSIPHNLRPITFGEQLKSSMQWAIAPAVLTTVAALIKPPETLQDLFPLALTGSFAIAGWIETNPIRTEKDIIQRDV